MNESNKGLSVVAGVASLVGAASLVVLLVSMDDARLLWLALGGGAIGAVVGYIAGRSGANSWNKVGLWLGVITLVAAIALMLFVTPVDVTTTEVTEEISAA